MEDRAFQMNRLTTHNIASMREAVQRHNVNFRWNNVAL